MRRAMRRVPGVVLALVLLGAAVARAADRVGSVAALEGAAEVQAAGQATWTPLAAGADVALGDRIRTAVGGRVRLLLRDDSVLTVGPSSELVVDTHVVVPAAASSFSLPFGAIRALVGDRYGEPGSRFEIGTPTAVAGVRGTTFVVLHERETGETLVVGVVDVVRVRARSDETSAREVAVGPNQLTRVRPGRFPTAPQTLTTAELEPLLSPTLLRTGGREAALELATPEVGETGRAEGVPGDDPARPVAPPPGVLDQQERAVDQPIDRLRQLQRRRPPPIPPVQPGQRGR